jgi:hypothetical protein
MNSIANPDIKDCTSRPRGVLFVLFGVGCKGITPVHVQTLEKWLLRHPSAYAGCPPFPADEATVVPQRGRDGWRRHGRWLFRQE